MVAAVTMGFGDHAWNDPYARCVAKGDQVAIHYLEETYLAAATDDADYRREVSKTIYGRDIPYVLLMHIGALDARMLPRLPAMYQKKGFHFITLEEAEQDPAYQSDTDLARPPASRPPETAKGADLPQRIKQPDITKLCQ